MHLKVLNQIFIETQNLGSYEDIVTGALSTIFLFCPDFTNKFFKKILGKESIVQKNNYYVNTGPKMASDGDWLKKK